MPEGFKVILNGAVKIINYVKSRPLQARILQITAEDMTLNHYDLLLHTEVRWLSRVKL